MDFDNACLFFFQKETSPTMLACLSKNQEKIRKIMHFSSMFLLRSRCVMWFPSKHQKHFLNDFFLEKRLLISFKIKKLSRKQLNFL